jgi:hypothetical protein
MKICIAGLLVFGLFISCNQTQTKESKPTIPISGTWKLISGTTIQGKDTVTTDYQHSQSFIKVINDSHFAFLKHNLGKDSATGFDAGGGAYTLADSTYTEHLEYCLEKEWEGHDFSFTISIKNDTLVQTGIEKLEKLGINRLNMEKYYRIKQ